YVRNSSGVCVEPSECPNGNKGSHPIGTHLWSRDPKHKHSDSLACFVAFESIAFQNIDFLVCRSIYRDSNICQPSQTNSCPQSCSQMFGKTVLSTQCPPATRATEQDICLCYFSCTSKRISNCCKQPGC